MTTRTSGVFLLQLLIVIGPTVLFHSHAWGQEETLIVRVDGDNGLDDPTLPNPGDTWSNSFLYLQDAIDFAEFRVGDEDVSDVRIWIKGDTVQPYRPDQGDNVTPGDREASFALQENDIALLGGFEGDELLESERDPVLVETVLSGDLNGNDVTAVPATFNDNSFHVVTAEGVNATAIIDGCVIRNGHADDPSGFEIRGGGMKILNASPRIEGCEPPISSGLSLADCAC